MTEKLALTKLVTLIVAVDEGGVIGYHGMIPWWDCAELRKHDMRHFRELTMGKPVVMGRVTAESIIRSYVSGGIRTFESFEQILPGRKSVIVSKTLTDFPGAEVYSSLESALKALDSQPDVSEICMIGGQRIYQESIGLARWIELTKIHSQFPGDAYFPNISPEDWSEVPPRQDFSGNPNYSFIKYIRKNN